MRKERLIVTFSPSSLDETALLNLILEAGSIDEGIEQYLVDYLDSAIYSHILFECEVPEGYVLFNLSYEYLEYHPQLPYFRVVLEADIEYALIVELNKAREAGVD